MELLQICLVLAATFKLSSGVAYNIKVEANSSFSCYTEVFRNDTKAIKLFLPKYKLEVICHLYDYNKPDTKENRRKNLLLYTSAGLAPSIQIFNSTYSKVFYFKMSMGEDVDSWSISIAREEITYNTDIAPIEEWFVKFNMHHGLNMFTTEGTLLDIMREPILQWIGKLGTPVDITSKLHRMINTTLTKSPCASDAAILSLIYDAAVPGVVLGITDTGFMSRDTKWYNLSDNICSVLEDDCAGLALVDVILINTRLIILTTLGLFISEDLRYPSESVKMLRFKKPTLCGFEMDDYLRARIWYSRQCLANREKEEVDYVGLSFNKEKTLSQESTCFYSNDSFTKWHNCLPHRTPAERAISRRVVSFIVDYEQNTGIAILYQQSRALVSVHKLEGNELKKQRKFPAFWFPDPDFIPFGMFFHPGSHFLYAYGNQVWISFDGGNVFIPIMKLENETIVETDTCVYTQAIVFVSDKGTIFYTKAGMQKYARLRVTPGVIFSMYFDHLGSLNYISLNSTSADDISVSEMDVQTLLKGDDLGFNAALSAQYVTEEQMIFCNHRSLNPAVPDGMFNRLHIGKAFEYGPGGSGVISKVFRKTITGYFLSCVLVDVLDRFPVELKAASPATSNTITIMDPTPGSDAYLFQLDPSAVHIFKATDVEKTVVIPGMSSFLITQVLSQTQALGNAVMPNQVIVNRGIPPEQWFLYDFGTTNGRKWRIIVDICRYTIQQFDDLPLHAIEYLDIGSQLQFSFRVTPVNVAYQVFHRQLMRVVVGRPTLLDVDTTDYWDDSDSYVIHITVQSRFFEQGKTSIAVIIRYASLICDVTTIVLTMKNSCSYLKTMHYILPVEISEEDWLSNGSVYKHNTTEGSKFLKSLPVNYRPPSVLGIAVPLTENFYNVDPSKPRMRDYFSGSKATGKYKQCANKTNRAGCKCTSNMKVSFSVAFSDCKEKALRMKFPVIKLPLYFTVEEEGRSQNMTSPYFITIVEVNNRTNWRVSGTNLTSSTIKMKKLLEHVLGTELYNPEGLSISIMGSELFHFRVSTIPGASFCNLFDEFQIYVDDPPLAFPGQYLISTITAVAIGGIIFMAFILHVYEIQIGTILKKLKRNKVASKGSFTSVSATSTEISDN
ncbi:cation channel sperm-associated auxiliary subunit beta isoform X1 [Anolis carolinensis]|uniref:cation channel sperm-associated auxiliary subunit beta isoform X1 n=1 Tax=Anolis carolinensis TaxID=28377 RepID=UPI002F2B51D6